MAFKPKESPVILNAEYDVKIESVGAKGDGVCKIGGLVIFVPNTEVDRMYRIKISEICQKYARAEIMEEK